MATGHRPPEQQLTTLTNDKLNCGIASHTLNILKHFCYIEFITEGIFCIVCSKLSTSSCIMQQINGRSFNFPGFPNWQQPEWNLFWLCVPAWDFWFQHLKIVWVCSIFSNVRYFIDQIFKGFSFSLHGCFDALHYISSSMSVLKPSDVRRK